MTNDYYFDLNNNHMRVANRTKSVASINGSLMLSLQRHAGHPGGFGFVCSVNGI